MTADATSPPTHQTRWEWVADPDPRWDDDRARVIGAEQDSVFPQLRRIAGERLPGDWWAVTEGGRVVGYGWLDDVWGDAEILLAVAADRRGTGAGAYALARLEREAAARGLNYVLNVVRDTHPQREQVTAWFLAHGFGEAEDGRLRKRVGDRTGDTGQRQDGRPGARPAPLPDAGRQARYEAERDRVAAHAHASGGDVPAAPAGAPRGPGHEESGGYVDPEQHRY